MVMVHFIGSAKAVAAIEMSDYMLKILYSFSLMKLTMKNIL